MDTTPFDLPTPHAPSDDHALLTARRIAELEAALTLQQERIAELERQQTPTSAPGPMSRRSLIGMAGVGLATAATLVSSSPAAAADPNDVVLGANNFASSTTQITSISQDGASAFRARKSSPSATGPAILAETDGTGAAVDGRGGNVGIFGYSDTESGRGVHGYSPNGTGVFAGGRTGVYGFAIDNTNGTGVYGVTSHGVGVDANANGTGSALVATAVTGVGAQISSEDIPVHLVPSTTRTGAPTTSDHEPGMLFVDAIGDFYLCTAAGSPGTWTRLNRRATERQTFLPTASRGFDSRLGTPGSGTKGTFGSGENRVVDLTLDTAVPSTATAAVVNLTVVNTASPNGFASLYDAANADLKPPKFSHINWFGSSQIMANTTTVAASQGRVKVYASGPTDILLDVIGYFG